MASTEGDLRRREAELVRRGYSLQRREHELAAREAELTGGPSWRAVLCRLAFAPISGLRLAAGLWLMAGATVFGGTVLIASAIGCGVLLITTAVIQLAECDPPPSDVSRWRRWLGSRLPVP